MMFFRPLPTDPQTLRAIGKMRTSLRAVGIRVTRHQIWKTLLKRAKEEQPKHG